MSATPWGLTPGLYVVDNDGCGEGIEIVLSGPWFTDEDAEADKKTWDGDVSVIGWLR